MANLSDEQRRALHILALSPNGCSEEAMLAHGFELATLGDLMFGGFALATPRDTRAGRLIVWMELTEAGRQAIAG
jgi:hypothetical protein